MPRQSEEGLAAHAEYEDDEYDDEERFTGWRRPVVWTVGIIREFFEGFRLIPSTEIRAFLTFVIFLWLFPLFVVFVGIVSRVRLHIWLVRSYFVVQTWLVLLALLVPEFPWGDFYPRVGVLGSKVTSAYIRFNTVGVAVFGLAYWWAHRGDEDDDDE